ncbi:Cobalt-zinc-cadmium resistance protein CzcC precursor [Aquisphaera giovannonii]|uniref:Cobalt-zinc-cadmium resistance protein CzcC n=1 Tax=Aquisphaera giovannonii TaxID=406548 RepID=A0A5B9W2N0_9BACT|nr:TolC family protein [Aquisphaera giovannonii]QEH34200.1 Cobalt-zinc-cadmium resistance protein CzcC precursor [Aquisphaera giovannonii]
MRSISWPRRGILAIACLLASSRILAQGPTIPEPLRTPGQGSQSLLGPALGGMGGMGDSGPPGAADEPLSGRIGTAVPRVPATVTSPNPRQVGVPERERITTPSALPLAEVPLFGPLSVPRTGEEVGPAGGLTLDQAIERLVHENLALKARALELPQADADILTASLRANPVLYADSQLVPYGSYTKDRPGGQTQYDVNITYPLDVTHKRKARTMAAARAKNVLQAQYQDAVRIQIDNLYTAYSEFLGARETIRFADAARQGLDELLTRTRGLQEKGTRTIADVSRIEALLEASEVQLLDARETLQAARRNLGVLLNMPGGEAEALELRGTLRDAAPPPPPIDELVRMALECRPDVVAFRMGVHRAEAEVKLARANRMSDVYVLYQPYTFQDNRPTGTHSATSWALGVTVPLPVYNRNQGNIQRSHVNLTQSHVELAEREQQAANEVRQAERQYALTRAAVQRIEARLLPSATRVRDDAYKLFLRGEEDAIVYLNAQREFNEASRQYRDMLVRHRLAMLRLNTAVGQRLLP